MTNENTETTGAVEAAAEAIGEACYGQELPEAPIDLARAALTAALDVEEMARAADPEAFEDHPIESRSRVAAIQWAARRKIATDHAQRIRAAILGEETR